MRDLRGLVDLGPCDGEAASAGFYTSPWGKHPRRHVLTIEDLLAGKTIDRPPVQTSATFKKAPKAKGKTANADGPRLR